MAVPAAAKQQNENDNDENLVISICSSYRGAIPADRIDDFNYIQCFGSPFVAYYL
jgi:hypothetical protein